MNDLKKIIWFNVIAIFLLSNPCHSHGYNSHHHHDAQSDHGHDHHEHHDRELSIETRDRCSMKDPTTEELEQSRKTIDDFYMRTRKINPLSSPERAGSQEVIYISTWFHIITGVDGQGIISQNDTKEQLTVLNEAFSQTSFQFYLSGINCISNNAWYDAETDGLLENEMKSTLRQGNGATLNIFFKLFEDGTLGYAYFPWLGPGTDEDVVVLGTGTIPNGELAPYNEGDTLVHEVGHWLGLLHTFQGGCSRQGDGVDDTPSERSPARGCPSFRNTCWFNIRTGLGGLGFDPVQNYMDYSYDSCMFEFTPGQNARMLANWETYRAPFHENPTEIPEHPTFTCS